MKSRHWMSLGAQSLNVEWADWFCHRLPVLEPGSTGGRWGSGGGGVGGHGEAMLPETFTLSGGNVKEVVGGLGCLLLVNMTGNKHHGIVFQHGCPSIHS